MTKIETHKPIETDKPELYVLGPPNLCAWCFFLVEAWSDRVSKAEQVSQPVWACQPGLGDLSKPNALAYFLGVKLMFVGVMLMFVDVMNLGQVQKIRFIVVKIFWTNF